MMNIPHRGAGFICSRQRHQRYATLQAGYVGGFIYSSLYRSKSFPDMNVIIVVRHH